MPPGRRLGEAFVVISTTGPDKAKVQADVRRALAGISGEVPVNADLSAFRAKLEAAIRKAMTGMRDQAVGIGPDTGDFRARLAAAVNKALTGLNPEVKVDADLDDEALLAQYTSLLDKLRTINQGSNAMADLLDVDLPQGRLIQQLHLLRRLIQQSGLADMLGVNLNDSQIREQLSKLDNLDTTVNIGTDISAATGPLAALQERILALTGGLTNLRIRADTTEALVPITALQARLARLAGQVKALAFNGDTSALDAKIAREEASLAALQQKMDSLQLDADAARLVAKIAGLEKQAADLGDKLGSLSPDIDVRAGLAELAELETQVSALYDTLDNLPADVDISTVHAGIQELEQETSALHDELDSLVADVDIRAVLTKLALVEADLKALNSEALKTRLGADAAALTAAITAKETQIAQLKAEAASIRLGAVDTTALAGIDAAMVKIEADAAKIAAALAPASDAVTSLLGQAEALAGWLGSLAARVNGSEGEAELARLQAQAAALAERLGNLPANVGTADIAKARSQFLGLEDAAMKFAVSLDPANAEIADLIRKTTVLGVVLGGLQARVTGTDAGVELAKLQAAAATLAERLGNLPADVSPAGIAQARYQFTALAASARQFTDSLGPANAQIVTMIAQVADLSRQLSDLKAIVTTAQGSAQIGKLQAQADLLAARLNSLPVNVSSVQIASARNSVTGLANAVASLDDKARQANALWAALGKALATTGVGWTATIGGIAGWHIVLDLAIEAAISLGTAMLALGAAAAAVYPAVDQLSYALNHQLQAMTALGQDAGPLAGKLDQLQRSVVPQVYEALGGALQLVNGQMGGLARTAHDVVDMFDRWIAKIDIWVQHQNGVNGILHTGTGYLAQFGKLIGTLLEALSNLLTKDPGVARFLLDILQGVVLLLDAFSKLPAPVVEATLALHGLWLWSRVLGGVLLNAASGAVKMGTAMAGLAVNPLFWVAAAAAALGYLAYQSTQATTSAKIFVAAINQRINSDAASTAITDISRAIGQLNAQIQDTTVSNALPKINQQLSSWGPHFQTTVYALRGISDNFSKFLNDVPESLKSWPNLIGTVRDFGHAVASIFSPGQSAAVEQTRHNLALYQGAIVSLTHEQSDLFYIIGKLTGGQNSLHIGTLSVAQALGLMDAAGVRANDTAAQMYVEVANLVHGYQAMSIQGTVLANSISALNFQTAQQDSKVTQLNSAWDTFFKTVSGGASGIVSFEQSLKTMQQQQAGTGQAAVNLASAQARMSAAQVALNRAQQSGSSTSAQLAAAHQRLSAAQQALALASTKAGGSMTGLDSASLTLRQDFLQAADAANAQVDNLTLLDSAAGQGARGTNLLAQATRDMVAQMLPAARNSDQLRTVLYALAQRGGYQGANSFKALSAWVNQGAASMQKAGGPAKQLDSITTDLTIAAGNLAKDVQNLAIALGQTLNDAMAKAILQAGGGQKVFDDFANSLAKGYTNSQAQQQAALALGNQLVALTGNTTDAHNEFVTFAKQLGISQQDADKLWKEIAGNLNPALANAADKVVPAAETSFVSWARNGLNLGTDSASKLWQQLTGKLGPELGTLAGKSAPEAQKAFEAWAGRGGGSGLGLTQSQAQKLWGFLNSSLLPQMATLTHSTAPGAQKAFEAWAGPGGSSGLGLTTKQADALWRKLQTLQGFINTMHGTKVGVNFVGSGTGQIAFKESIPGVTTGPSSQGLLGFHAAGGRIPGFAPGVDNYPAMLSGGEYVFTPEAASAIGYDRLDQINKAHSRRRTGYAAGGAVGASAEGGVTTSFSGITDSGGVLVAGQPWMAKVEKQFGEAVEKAFAEAVIKKFKADMAALLGGGGSIVRDAESWIGKIPYVWGGNSFAGTDCSGFVSLIYNRHGIHPPRTSEAQGAWVKRTGAVPGGLAFYHSPPGGPDPGHVAIVADAGHVVSQGGGRGPQWETINFLPLLWTGIPPHGFPGGAGAGGPVAPAGSVEALMQTMAANYGWTGIQWQDLYNIEMAEAGFNLRAVNPASGAYGLAQFIGGPSEYFQYGGNPNTAAGQIIAMLNYIANRYGTPAKAWAFHLAHGYYGQGGLVGYAAGGTSPEKAAAMPYTGATSTGKLFERFTQDARFASGGAVSAYRGKLAGEQSAIAKYYGQVEGARKGTGKRTQDELGTLSRREAAEVAAYRALAGSGLTKPALDRLGSAAREEDVTAHDQGLARQPGIGNLQRELSALYATAHAPPALAGGGSGSGGSSSGSGGGTGTTAQLVTKVKAAQKIVVQDYARVAAAGRGRGLPRRAKDDLATLARRQSAEVAAYASAIRDPTAATMKHLAATARDEKATALDKGLAGLAGTGALESSLAVMASLAGNAVAAGSGSRPGRSGGGSPGNGIANTGKIPKPASKARLLSELKAAQNGERLKYAGLTAAYRYDLAHAKPGSWTSGHRSGILSELSTLAKRENAEIAAYNAVTRNATAANLGALAARASEVFTVSKDAGLSHSHPGFTRDLQFYLGEIWHLSGQGSGTAGSGITHITQSELKQLVTDQGRQRSAYSSFHAAYAAAVASARKGSWIYGHKAGITSELGTLAKRENAEIAAYNTVIRAGTKASKSQLDHLAATVREVITTTRDQDLSSPASGMLGRDQALQAGSNAILKLLGQATVAGTAGSGSGQAFPKLQFTEWLRRLKTTQGNEVRDYNAIENSFRAELAHAPKNSWEFRNRKALSARLREVAKRQADEVKYYGALMAHVSGSVADTAGLPGRSASLNNTVAALAGNLQPALLGHVPGGFPRPVKDLQVQLSHLNSLTSAHAIPGVQGSGPPVNPPWNPGNLGPLHTVAGGVLQFDTGRGVLPPGLSLTWNGTGRDEPLSSHGARFGGCGDVHLHLHNHGVIGSQAELENWLVRSANKLARTGRLTQAVKTANR